MYFCKVQHLYFLGLFGTVNQVSLHPPHLIDSSGSLTPAALIPFCAYQTNMTLLGQKADGINFTTCSQFKPTVLESQLCYSLNLRMITSHNTGAGLDNGIFILLDSGISEIDQSMEMTTLGAEDIVNMEMEPFSPTESSARIYLNTLSSISDFRAGSYAMTALKKMTGTERFLKQTNMEKNCRSQELEDCQAKGYIDRVWKKCGCVPWALSSALVTKVGHLIAIIRISICYEQKKNAVNIGKNKKKSHLLIKSRLMLIVFLLNLVFCFVIRKG